MPKTQKGPIPSLKTKSKLIEKIHKKNEHEAKNKTKDGEQVYSLVVGFKSGFADHAGNAPSSVSDVAGFKECIGSDVVFDLSTPSVFDPEPQNKEVKSLYERFVKAGEKHEVPPSITRTFMPTSYKSDLEETQVTFGLKSNTSSINTLESNDFPSCDNSDKSSNQKLMTLHLVFQVPRPMTPSLLLVSRFCQ
nr:ribonuclease H-like domain, reverse transcriptase, RNA-dependent DNA polymerase [Tanacetum cinerariifolium]